jgi:hypothetical protein
MPPNLRKAETEEETLPRKFWEEVLGDSLALATP